MAACLTQVKGEIGPSAVILHTRTIYERYCFGLRKREIIEITAGRGEPRRKPPMQAPEPPPQRKQIAAYQVNSQPGKQLLESPAAGNVMMLGLSKEVCELKAAFAGFVSEFRHQKMPQVPEELFDEYLRLIQNQVAEELAIDIVKNIHKSVRPEHLQQADFIREKIAEQVEKLIPTAGPIIRTKSHGPHVVALIGPTGVGKTTTIAKLAAKLKLEERRTVGLITSDTYRIAAIEQLRRYAELLQAPLCVVNEPQELRDAIASMHDCEFILLDTAGRSPKDTLKLNELKNYITAAQADEVHLVLSTTASQECVELAIERFADVRCDKIIFTKLDEAAHVGVVLNVVRKVNKALSYVTNGQDVPDDIEVGHGRKLAQMILGM
jgi:flagellar biosynthesis protein FlhF